MPCACIRAAVHIGPAVMVERKRIVTVADVATVNATQAEGFEVSDQRAVPSTRLGKATDPTKVRNQRHRCRPWCRVEVCLPALEVGSLAHHPAPRVGDVIDLKIDLIVSWVRLTVPIVRLCGLTGGLLQSRR
jgi:hypothetical protein